MSNQPTLSDYAHRMRSLVEEDLRIAADLREIAKEMRERGYQAVVLKAVVKAQVAQENGDEKPMERLKARTQEIAIYADALGEPIEGFGETKRFVVNNSDNDPPHDSETGEIIEHESQAKPEASAPVPDPSGEGEDPENAIEGAGQSGSRSSGGDGTAAPNSDTGGLSPPVTESREASESSPQPADAEALSATAVPRPVDDKTAAPIRIPSSAVPPPEDCPDIPDFLRRTA